MFLFMTATACSRNHDNPAGKPARSQVSGPAWICGQGTGLDLEFRLPMATYRLAIQSQP